MRSQTIIDKIKSILESNLTDPNDYRSGNWIYTDEPRLDATKPRIGIEFIDDSREWLSINSKKKVISGRIQISIFIDTTTKYDIDGDGEPEKAEDVLDYLQKQVENAIRNNQSQIKALDGVLHALPGSSNNKAPDDNVKARYLDIIAVYI